MMPALRRFGRPLLGLAILVLAVISTDPAAILARIGAANVGLVIVGVGGLTAMHIVPALGWRRLVDVIGGIRLPYPTALALYYAAQAIGGVTPANVGGDVHRATSLRGRGWSAAIAPLIVQRATSYLALSSLALMGVAALAAGTSATLPIALAGLAFATAVGGIAWLLLAPPEILAGAHRRLTAFVAGTAPSAWQRTPRLRAATVIGVGSGLVFHAGSIGLTWLLIAAVNPSAAGLTMLAAVALARLSLAVPLTPSGIGVQEGALAVMLASLGIAADSALAGMLLARLALLTTTLIGVALLAGGRRGARQAGAAPTVRVTPPA